MNTLTVNGLPIDYSGLPEHMREGMQLYLESGIPGGSFMMAVLSNDFMEACARADSINLEHLSDWARWLYNHAPPSSFGSYEKVNAWMKNVKKP